MRKPCKLQNKNKLKNNKCYLFLQLLNLDLQIYLPMIKNMSCPSFKQYELDPGLKSTEAAQIYVDPHISILAQLQGFLPQQLHTCILMTQTQSLITQKQTNSAHNMPSYQSPVENTHLKNSAKEGNPQRNHRS